MNVRRITKWWLSMLAFTMVAMTSIQAQTTTAPIKLVVVKTELGGTVKLVWTRPAGVTMSSYALYRVVGTDTSKAGLIVDTKDTSYTDQLPLTFDAVTKYTYYVAGKPATGSVLRSNTVAVSIIGIQAVGSFTLTAAADNSTGTVKLAWTKPPVPDTTIVKYYVYRYGGFMSSIQKVDSTTGLTATDKPPLTSGTGNMMAVSGYSDDARYGFTYYVVAQLKTRSLQSTSASVVLSVVIVKDTVKFVTSPVTSAQINVAYKAKVLATSSDAAATITYVLDRYPSGMTLIDSAGAKYLKWLPKSKGMYDIHVMATSSKLGTARQDYSITVIGGNGIVSGKVVDTTGAPIAKVIIQLMQRNWESHSN
jgi:hypothetical protein